VIHEPLTEDEANAIYDVLVQHAGALEDDRRHFVQIQTDKPCTEFRFIGSLGFGGKFRRVAPEDRWYVDCYSEDMTPERERAIRITNAALDGLRASFVVLGEALR
jgi:hypothetical protein